MAIPDELSGPPALRDGFARSRGEGVATPCDSTQTLRPLQNLVSAGPWPSAASPWASSALRIQSRRTNRGRSPGYGICKQRLNRRARRPRRSPQTEERQGIRSSWGRARSSPKQRALRPGRHKSRGIGPRSRESSGTSRGDDEAHGCAMMPQLDEDSATGTGWVATRRLDADDRVRISTVRSSYRAPPRQDRGRHAATGSGFRASRRHANPREAVSLCATAQLAHGLMNFHDNVGEFP